jgi:hypothetical protein
MAHLPSIADCIASTLAVAIVVATAGRAEAQRDATTTLDLVEENDSFLGTDRHYTQGLRLSYGSPETASETLHGLSQWVMLPPAAGETRLRYGLHIGQSIFTPADLSLAVPDPLDRPYAGWLYGGGDLYRESGDVLDRAGVTLGLVGPGAGGELVQNNWHSLIGGIHANGWGAQLRNEPGLVLSAERKWRLPAALGPFEADLIPEANLALGNVFDYGALGGEARLGRRLAADWGPPRVQPALSGTDYVNGDRLGSAGYAWYFFAGLEGRLVGRNIFLDGNSFERSASVDKEPLVGDFNAGAALVIPYGRLAVSWTHRTAEFRGQGDDDQFLSIALGLHF